MKKKKPQISRRDFIKYSAIGLTASTLPVSPGCSTLTKSNAPVEECQSQNLVSNIRYKTKVFAPANIAGIKLNNRIIRAATALNLPAEKGKLMATDKFIEKFTELCQGGVGAIITGCVAIQQNGASAFENALLIDKDIYVAEFKKISDAVHKFDTSIIMQIGHDGPITRRVNTGAATVAPSAIGDKSYTEETPKALSEIEIMEIIDNFISAIGRAQRAGFDGVELMAAHGSLLSAFLSPNSNIRTDKWGGSTENRFRIIKKIIKRAKKQFKDYPILVKINAYDFQSDGMRVKETVKIAKLLEDAGCDGIEVSSGVAGDGFSTVRVYDFPTEMLLTHNFNYKDMSPALKTVTRCSIPLISWMYQYEPIYNFNICAAQQITEAVSIPVIVVGGIRKLNDIEQIIGNNMADYVSMARPFIIEPDIVNKFKAESQTASECLECGHCILALEEMPVECFYGEVP